MRAFYGDCSSSAQKQTLPEKSKELANLARTSKLAVESGTRGEITGLLAKAHEVRDAAEYAGQFDADATLPEDLIDAAEMVRVTVAALPALPDK